MTEKRFKLFVGKNYGVQKVDGEVIFDSIVSIGDADVLVDLLNELHDENKQLKTKVDFYKYFQKDARELEKENEQLKKNIQEKEEVIEFYQRFCGKSGIK